VGVDVGWMRWVGLALGVPGVLLVIAGHVAKRRAAKHQRL
jgi:hypothetical protein